ncbi:uncharacterized protein A1O9_06579, partial [Exophiala aquamarina CBS 119918]
MPPRGHTRSVSRRSTPLSPPKPSPQSGLGDARRQNKTPIRSISREVLTDAQNDLLNIDQVLETVNEEESIQHSDFFDHPSSVSASSESVSSLQNDLKELEHDEIVEYLPNLHSESLAVLSSFDISEEDRLNSTILEMSRTGSLPRKLHIRAEKLKNSRKPFAEGDFINPVLIVRKLAGIVDLHHINYGRWRPDAILYLANLAQQMVKVLSGSSADRLSLLTYLYNNFPRAFVGDRKFSFATGLIEDTRNLAIEVMTQFFIYTLDLDGMGQLESPGKLADQIFDNDDAVSHDFRDEDSLEAVVSRLELLKGNCTIHTNLSELLDELKQLYPWSAFILQTAKWSNARVAELKEIIAKQGGIENIVRLLDSRNYEADVKGKLLADTRNDLTDTPSEARPNNNHQSSLNDPLIQGRSKRVSVPLNPRMISAEIRQFREEQAKHTLELSGLRLHPSNKAPIHEPREIQQTPTPVDDDDYRALQDSNDGQIESNHLNLPSPVRESFNDGDGGDDDDELPPSTQQTLEVMKTLERQAIEREKENRPAVTKRSFLDRQPDARKIKWQGPAVGDREPRSRQPSKPFLPEIDDEEEEEENFEQDQRPTKISRTATGKQLAPRIHDVDSILDAGFGDDGDNITPSSQPVCGSRQTPAATNLSNRPPRSTAPTLSQVQPPPRARMAEFQAEARAMTAESKDYYGPRTVQVRIPWNDLESDRLIEMVARQGTKWARILHEDAIHEDGPLLQNRSQVALKDKARNIKILYLKTRRRLPPGFESVSIGQRQINELKDLGIDYIEGRFEGQNL